ncbi:CBO0543 family protein [Metabacillus litoralis]|uniref:CBO0543 family protein n=1 Tax=Metabacillus litoralis TaxID=152268 RepID=UPI000EF5BD97|nr:CBO0543 family protein [Metabacillus litoralis]
MSPSITDIMETQEKLSKMRWEYYQHDIIFSFQWWFLIVTFIILFIVWIRLLDKSRLLTILLFGFITLNIVTFLDTLGGELQIWEYPKMILPWGPRILCIDLMISIYFMLLYQFFTKWRSYIFASIVLAAVFSFIFEPIAKLLGIYIPISWSHLYSFPIYILLAISIRYLIEKLITINNLTKG